MSFLLVNGERIPKSEATELIRMLMEDAKQIAGEFHTMERSEKFRANWPDEDVFAECEWRNFMEAARARYAERLGDPKTKPYDARRMLLAIVLWTMVEQDAPEKYGGLQIAPNTQAFEGDRRENRKTIEKFGRQSDTFKDLLMGSTRYH